MTKVFTNLADEKIVKGDLVQLGNDGHIFKVKEIMSDDRGGFRVSFNKVINSIKKNDSMIKSRESVIWKGFAFSCRLYKKAKKNIG